MNKLFTEFTDWFSESMGKWQVFFFFAFLILGWGAAGPLMHYSDSWQLYINTPTTIIELFLGLATLSSANRIEKRNYDLHISMLNLIQKLEAEEQEELQLLRHESKES